jgi:zonular occludens toxin Zot
MSKVYFIEGNLGDGKSLISVGKILDRLRKGKRVATNLDLFPENMPINKNSRKHFNLIRLPDYPTVDDMWSLGKGYEGKIKRGKEGLIVLDECASWLNSRSWNSKERLPFIQWFTHARKLRWDVIFLIQSADAIDSQLRLLLMKLRGRCYVNKDFLWIKYLPQFHFCSVRRVLSTGSSASERWLYRGTDLYDSYDTEQIFDPFYPSGMYSVLTPWHLKGRYEEQESILTLVREKILLSLKYLLLLIIQIDSIYSGRKQESIASEYGVLKIKESKIIKHRDYFIEVKPVSLVVDNSVAI